MTKQDIATKESLEILKNFNDNITYLYSGNKRNLDLESYDSSDEDEILEFSEELIYNLLDEDSNSEIYSRFFQFDEYFEYYLNSYFFLLYDNLNYKLESIDFHVNLNNLYKKPSYYLDLYTIKISNLEKLVPKVPAFKEGDNLYEYIKLNYINLMIDVSNKKTDEEKLDLFIELFRVNNIFEVDDFIKDSLFNNTFLFSNYLNDSIINNMN